jgi:hypothetical protein
MIGVLSRVPNAQNATSYDGGGMNAHEGRKQRQVRGHNRAPLDEIMIPPLVSKVNPFHLADFAALRDCPCEGEAASVARLKAFSSVRNCLSNRRASLRERGGCF